MPRIDLNSLVSFILVARETSFTRAAAQLEITQSALSHSIRRLEEKHGVRLLALTTRGVSLTEAGQRLFEKIEPLYEGIAAELAALSDTRDRPAGTIRINATEYVARTYLWPRLSKLLPAYPEIEVEIAINYGLVDIVAERFDAGVRFGALIAKDMIAARISPDIRMAVVASPAYIARRGQPHAPEDLALHDCINLRLPTYGGLLQWEFVRGGQPLELHVHGQLTFNSVFPIIDAARDGFGLAHVPEGLAADDLAAGRLIPVLADYWPTLPGYHLYYPSRRLSSPAFVLVADALRYKL